jgi:hypothetical protein
MRDRVYGTLASSRNREVLSRNLPTPSGSVDTLFQASEGRAVVS